MKVMRIFKLLIVLALFVSASAPEGEGPSKIKWVDFNTGFMQAQEEGKIAIIDCYTDWCGWCKVMDKKTFTNDTIINRINDNYIAIKFNPEKPGKYLAGTGDSLTGRQLLLTLSNNKPSGYPTFFYFVPQSKKMFQVPGYKDVNALNEILDNVERYQVSVLSQKP
jgi:thioredoxin-related protein